MRTLHVAALPYRTSQGTQALLHAMLSALAEAGHDTHVLCYAHGTGQKDAPYVIHRAADVARDRSLRSGPSTRKLLADVALAAAARRLAHELEPTLIVAHHVEAALALHAAGLRQHLFVAHTSLSAELPGYFPLVLHEPLSRCGRALDRWLCRRAHAVRAVSPLLAERLSREADRAVAPLPLLWPETRPVRCAQREQARAQLGLGEVREVALYAGNLDAYQGLDELAQGVMPWLARGARRRWLIATSGPFASFRARLPRAQREQVVHARANTEPERELVYDAADVALVPRHSPGGVPVKLLDALSRAAPVIANRRALAGLPLGELCTVVPDGCPAAFTAALDDVLAAGRPRAERRAAQGRAFVREHYTPSGFVRALEALTLSAAPCRSAEPVYIDSHT